MRPLGSTTYETKAIYDIMKLEIELPYRGLLSSSCKGMQPSATSEQSFGPTVDFVGRTDEWMDRRTDGQTIGLRELDNVQPNAFVLFIFVYLCLPPTRVFLFKSL